MSFFVLLVMVWLYQSACVCHLYMKMALSPPQMVGDRCACVTVWVSICVYVTLSAFAAGLAKLVEICANV